MSQEGGSRVAWLPGCLIFLSSKVALGQSLRYINNTPTYRGVSHVHDTAAMNNGINLGSGREGERGEVGLRGWMVAK